jgi:DUF5010 C-terminal domain
LDGNQPALVTATDDGAITLSATTAEIYGGEIVFEEPLQNIGFWHGQQDRASWRIEVSQSGKYEVAIDYACADDSAGNKFRLDGGEPIITGEVPSTGGWDQYRRVAIGTLQLSDGQQYITLRPDGPLTHGALMDLRGVVLTPVK